MRLFKTTALALALAFVLQGAALAAESLFSETRFAKGLYYTDTKIKGYSKGAFVVLEGDDVNFRERAENGAVLKVLPRHSLLRAIKQQGDWLQAESDGIQGYVYAPFTGAGEHEPLTTEDFAVGYAALGEKFDEQQAQEKLGKVMKQVIDKKTKASSYTYKYVIIGTKKQKITSIRVFDPKYITMRGVSVGDNAARAVGQYGVPDAVVYGAGITGKTIYEYFLPTENKKQRLRFALDVDKDSRVQAIILELQQVKK